MGDTNYFSGIVKILENTIQSFINYKTLTTTFRVEIPQMRQNKIISLVFWGNLADEVKNYYQINDYILIEGYTSIEKKHSELVNKKSGKTTITVLKVYPFLLKSNQDMIKG
jgi:single-stranded DNA-binding protein